MSIFSPYPGGCDRAPAGKPQLAPSIKEAAPGFEKVVGQGYTKITVEFSGSGDSGDIDAAFLEGPSGRREIEYGLVPELDWVLRLVQFDYYNNEGGGGTITLDLLTGEYTVEGYVNEIVEKPVTEGGSV